MKTINYKIIIIETSDVGAAYTAEAVKRLGYQPIFICTMSNYQSDTYNQIIKYTYYDCNDTTQIEPIVKVIESNDIEDIVGVITMLDSRLSVSFDLARYFNVPGVDPAVKTLCDKGKVARLIPEYSPKTISFRIGDVPFNDLENVLANCTRLVFKPTCSAGALGMFTITTSDQLKNIIDIIKNTSIDKLINGEWIAQPFLPGRLFSLEGYALNGKARFIGFSARQKIDNTESVNHFPANDFLNEKVIANTYQAINDLISRSNFQNGYFHTEFMIDFDRYYLIDANFGRIGGGAVAQQAALSYDKNPIDIYNHILEITLFKRTSLDIYQNIPLRTLSVNYGVPENAILSKVNLPNNLRVLHTQILNSGTLVPKMGLNNWSWLGILVGYPKELLKFLESVKIVTDKGEFEPCFLKNGIAELDKLVQTEVIENNSLDKKDEQRVRLNAIKK